MYCWTACLVSSVGIPPPPPPPPPPLPACFVDETTGVYITVRCLENVPGFDDGVNIGVAGNVRVSGFSVDSRHYVLGMVSQ